MGYFRYRLKCPTCGEEWNTFFASFDMSSGLMKCPKGCEAKPDNIADDWKMDSGGWMRDALDK